MFVTSSEGAVPRDPEERAAAPPTSGPGSGRALVRRRKEPAQAHEGRDAPVPPPSVLRGAASQLCLGSGGGKEPRWRRPVPARLACSCSC